MEHNVDQQTVYAEVLYTFKAVGAEELSLERGALVEVIRMESGPWWLGRIKHDAILSSDQSELRQGWFPRDFVKVSFIFPFVLGTIAHQATNTNQFNQFNHSNDFYRFSLEFRCPNCVCQSNEI